MKRRLLHIALLAGLGIGTAWADTLVCKQGQVVRAGMSAEEVLKKCGKPTSAVAKTEDRRRTNRSGSSIKIGEIYSEIWRYDRGSQKPAAIVTVEEGVVLSVEFEK